MAYRWQYENASGSAVPAPEVPAATAGFEGRDEAEGWLGENWAALLAGGVDQVTLLDGGVAVYGPMSLHPPQP